MPSHNVDSETLENLLDLQSELISAEPDLGSLMDLVARRSQDLVGAAGAAVELAEGTDMVYRAASGIASGQLGLRISRHGSFSGLCVEQAQALICHDSETDGRVNLEACRAVAQSRRSGSALGVALFDLDGLKAVNDTYGHQAGAGPTRSPGPCALARPSFT